MTIGELYDIRQWDWVVTTTLQGNPILITDTANKPDYFIGVCFHPDFKGTYRFHGWCVLSVIPRSAVEALYQLQGVKLEYSI